jgi:hypothetical protein
MTASWVTETGILPLQCFDDPAEVVVTFVTRASDRLNCDSPGCGGSSKQVAEGDVNGLLPVIPGYASKNARDVEYEGSAL